MGNPRVCRNEAVSPIVLPRTPFCLPFFSHLSRSALSAWPAQCREQNSMRSSSVKSISITVTICFAASFVVSLKKKKKNLSWIFFFSPPVPYLLPRASACASVQVLGSWVSNVRPCTELSKRRIGWDDWWLQSLKSKPLLQMLLLQKSWGNPQWLYSRSARIPLHPPLWASNKPTHS